jgi:hypothetical protein
MKSMETAFTAADKLAIIRETFSVHIVLAFFGGSFRNENNKIASDNLEEVVTQAKNLLAMTPYKQLLSQLTGQPIDVVRKALTFGDEASKKECLASLLQVYQGLVKMLPTREYQLVKTTGDLASKDDSDQFTL